MSQFFPTGGQSIGVSASASVFPMNIQDWFPLGWTCWIFLQSKGHWRVFLNTTVTKHQFFSAQLFLFLFIFFNWKLIILQYCGGFWDTFTWISHGCTFVPHPEPSSHLPPNTIPPDHPGTPTLSTLSHASNLDWWYISHMIIYTFQCYSLKSSHSCLLPQGRKICSLHLCLFCCLAYRVVVTVFLSSKYMH